MDKLQRCTSSEKYWNNDVILVYDEEVKQQFTSIMRCVTLVENTRSVLSPSSIQPSVLPQSVSPSINMYICTAM